MAAPDFGKGAQMSEAQLDIILVQEARVPPVRVVVGWSQVDRLLNR